MTEEKKPSKPADPDPGLVVELKKSVSPADPDPRLVNIERKELGHRPAEPDPKLWHTVRHGKTRRFE